MAMKVVNVRSEKVVDTNPNIYLERAEENLKNGRYDEALEEASLAVKYSNNNQRVIDQYNRIKNVLEQKKCKIHINKHNQLNEGSGKCGQEEYNLGIEYLKEAFKSFEKSAKQGNRKAEDKLKLIIDSKLLEILEKDKSEELIMLAEHGDKQAQFELGVKLHCKNIQEAYKWYEKAAKQGHKEAQTRVKAIDANYQFEESGLINNEEFKDLRALASSGDRRAQYELGMKYYNSDFDEAFKWLEKAAKQGHKEAKVRLDILISVKEK